MKYEVTFLISYTIEDAKDKWDAVEQAETMFSEDTHFQYDIDVNLIHDDK